MQDILSKIYVKLGYYSLQARVVFLTHYGSGAQQYLASIRRVG